MADGHGFETLLALHLFPLLGSEHVHLEPELGTRAIGRGDLPRSRVIQIPSANLTIKQRDQGAQKIDDLLASASKPE